MKRIAFVFLVLATAFIGPDALGQDCSYVLDMYSELSYPETESESVVLAGDLSSVTFNLNFAGPGITYPADMMVYLTAPNGQCIVWGGWDLDPDEGCDDVGTGAANSWPGDWSDATDQFYTYTLNTDDFGLFGSGTWTVTIQNAWTGAENQVVTYDLDVVFDGICEGDCFDPDACNFNPNATLVFNDLCVYATDLYPSGLYDCDGNCLLDFDNDGVCNENEVSGCQIIWACNYNPLATDPPPFGQPCTFPESDVVDCDGTSLLPQFLTLPQDQTVSCNNVPEPPVVAAQPAPASLAYYGLFPYSCYDDGADVDINFTENIIGGGECPGNYTIERLWVITDCKGFTNSMSQIIEVVDNLPPVVLTDLDPDTLGCDDNVLFVPLAAEDACGGNVSFVGDADFVTVQGTCPGESVQKKFTTLSDQCGNTTVVEQIVVVVDNDPPFWDPNSLPEPIIVTNDIEGAEFGQPVAGDVCSGVEVSFTQTETIGACPLSEVITRTYVALDQCGNASVPFVQTITEDTLVTASVLDASNVTCNGGNDGTISIEYEGGVGPYSVEWLGGYNPDALPAGMYQVTVYDANLCGVTLDSLLISEPGPFGLSLQATVPECTDAQSGTIEATVSGGIGDVSLEWGGINPNAVSAGTYSVQAIDESGCLAAASVVVPPADIPESLDLLGITSVVEGESAAYYYEYNQGSTYEWILDGATALQLSNTFAISVTWDSTGSVCVRETNTDGCVSELVCLEVDVEDDVWNVGENDVKPFRIFPNPASHVLNLLVQPEFLGQTLHVVDAQGRTVKATTLNQASFGLDVQAYPAGLYFLHLPGQQSQTFQVQR